MQRYAPPVRSKDDAESMRGDLDTFGVTCVRVMDEESAQAAALDVLGVLRRVRPDGVGADVPTPHGAKGCGFVPAYGHNQEEEVWRVRLNLSFREAQANLYGTTTTDLACSADNVTYWGPDAARTKKPSAKVIGGGDAQKAFSAMTGSSLQAHKDLGVGSHGAKFEAAMKEDKRILYPHSLQAQIVLKAVTETGASIVISPDSLRLSEAESRTHFHPSTSDFCTLTKAGYERLRETWIKVAPVPAGCAIIWRSDLVHANSKADFGADPVRLGIFVTWHPRGFVPYDKKRKMELVEQGFTSTHWPFLTQRWRSPGSHMSNGKGLSKTIAKKEKKKYPEELRRRIEEAV